MDELKLNGNLLEAAPREVPEADLRGLTVVVLLAAAGVTVEAFLARWGLEHPGPSPLGVVLAVWVLSPYLFLAAFLRRSTPSADRAALHFGACLLIGTFGVVACFWGLYREPNAQDGLVPLLVPVWQWVAAAGVAAGLRLLPD